MMVFGSSSRSRVAVIASYRLASSRAERGICLCLASDRVVLRLGMMHDDRRRALLRDQLECARQLHPQLALRRENLEQLRVILEVGTCAVAPRVALPLAGRHAE